MGPYKFLPMILSYVKAQKDLQTHILGDVVNSAQGVVTTGPPLFTTSFPRNIKVEEFI